MRIEFNEADLKQMVIRETQERIGYTPKDEEVFIILDDDEQIYGVVAIPKETKFKRGPKSA